MTATGIARRPLGARHADIALIRGGAFRRLLAETWT